MFLRANGGDEDLTLRMAGPLQEYIPCASRILGIPSVDDRSIHVRNGLSKKHITSNGRDVHARRLARNVPSSKCPESRQRRVGDAAMKIRSGPTIRGTVSEFLVSNRPGALCLSKARTSKRRSQSRPHESGRLPQSRRQRDSHPFRPLREGARASSDHQRLYLALTGGDAVVGRPRTTPDRGAAHVRLGRTVLVSRGERLSS